MIKKNTIQVMVGNVPVGGGSPVVVQSMTNTYTYNKKETCCANFRALESRFRNYQNYCK